METIKNKIQNWWDSSPCCSKIARAAWGTKEFYEQVDLYKDTHEPFTNRIADYGYWRDKRVLEIGCGLGKDFSRFIAAGAKATAIDMSARSLELTAKRLEIFGLKGNLCLADAENLPFKDNVFDLVFSWGVLHHTPDTQKAIDNIYKCLKPNGGKIIVMLYNRRSLKKLQISLKRQILSEATDGIGNPLSKVYSSGEIVKMFSRFKNINLCAYESKDSSFAKIFNFLKALERNFGWFMVITAEK